MSLVPRWGCIRVQRWDYTGSHILQTPHGHGRAMLQGASYAGEWFCGKQDGAGRLDLFGDVYVGFFHEGDFVEGEKTTIEGVVTRGRFDGSQRFLEMADVQDAILKGSEAACRATELPAARRKIVDDFVATAERLGTWTFSERQRHKRRLVSELRDQTIRDASWDEDVAAAAERCPAFAFLKEHGIR